MTESNYLTAGEVARRVGVTVRTVQYYDHQGLLSPSAKGPNNQRLYTDKDVQGLHRILTLKYLGMPLVQIKADAARFHTQAELSALADEQIAAIEDEFLTLFKRMTTLRAIRDESDGEQPVNWEHVTDVIERGEDESRFFWRLTCIKDDATDEQAKEDVARSESVSHWHALIADAIRAMASGEPLDSPQNRSIAERYLELAASQENSSIEDNFILMENIVPHKGGDGSFDKLRQGVFEHLEAVTQALRQAPPNAGN